MIGFELGGTIEAEPAVATLAGARSAIAIGESQAALASIQKVNGEKLEATSGSKAACPCCSAGARVY